MQFTTTLIALIIAAAPAFAAPAPVAENSLDARATTVICKPSKNESPTKSFKVDVDHAKSEMKKAGFSDQTLSGDPHKYNGGDGIKWNVQNCDAKGANLMEYPVYWVGAKAKSWQKDKKTQGQDKTPIRVVYANKGGAAIYCGIMTHSEVAKDYQGKKFFQKCT